jgi:copper chaperone CopZ
MEDHCQVDAIEKESSANDVNDAIIVRLAVDGMGCVNCGTRVRNSLLALEGVVSADVDWQSGLALVDYVPAKTTIDTLVFAVATAGNDGQHNYRAQPIAPKEAG